MEPHKKRSTTTITTNTTVVSQGRFAAFAGAFGALQAVVWLAACLLCMHEYLKKGRRPISDGHLAAFHAMFLRRGKRLPVVVFSGAIAYVVLCVPWLAASVRLLTKAHQVREPNVYRAWAAVTLLVTAVDVAVTIVVLLTVDHAIRNGTEGTQRTRRKCAAVLVACACRFVVPLVANVVCSATLLLASLDVVPPCIRSRSNMAFATSRLAEDKSSSASLSLSLRAGTNPNHNMDCRWKRDETSTALSLWPRCAPSTPCVGCQRLLSAMDCPFPSNEFEPKCGPSLPCIQCQNLLASRPCPFTDSITITDSLPELHQAAGCSRSTCSHRQRPLYRCPPRLTSMWLVDASPCGLTRAYVPSAWRGHDACYDPCLKYRVQPCAPYPQCPPYRCPPIPCLPISCPQISRPQIPCPQIPCPPIPCPTYSCSSYLCVYPYAYETSSCHQRADYNNFSFSQYDYDDDDDCSGYPSVLTPYCSPPPLDCNRRLSICPSPYDMRTCPSKPNFEVMIGSRNSCNRHRRGAGFCSDSSCDLINNTIRLPLPHIED